MNSPSTPALSPAPIMELSTAYWGSQALLTSNRIGIFRILGEEGALSVEELATKLGIMPRPTRLLLDACVGLGLLEKDDYKYRNSLLSKTYLVPGVPSYLGDAIQYSDNLYATWGELETALHQGGPPMQPETYLGRDEATTRAFVYGMHNRALGIGNAMLSLVDLSERKQMLDVGGGPGTYSALFTLRYPQLNATVLDLPDVTRIAAEIVQNMGAKHVKLLPGSYIDTEFPGGNDVVLISGVFHRETEATCQRLIAKARGSLNPGGMLIIGDVFTDEGGTSPAFATLFGINMLLTATDGGIHSDHAVQDWMQTAGFGKLRTVKFPPPMPHRLVMGVTSVD